MQIINYIYSLELKINRFDFMLDVYCAVNKGLFINYVIKVGEGEYTKYDIK